MPVTCGVCGREVANSFKLQEHLRTHSKSQPHACTTCGKAFARVPNLRRHELVHAEARPRETCGVCERQFYDAHTLRRHLRLHETRGACPFCPEAVNWRFLRGHVQRLHAGALVGSERAAEFGLCTRCGALVRYQCDAAAHERACARRTSETE
ncbi:Zinc finger domain-containing protein [Spironucleus salmonicida]|uniref:Zinc finger domain-containing protein n=1 Tax=Spironucleus salmonicida TaxID=348837 RepID=V6LPF3_9EUKA|nr:Zinc finger domain-containing protein [Spironucleus salmonicida]KAH0577094.1 Zinc finger domain-containing protein [Spironucleus salmonicida]|eukprot:EST45596.1 Zinc finger domain-containing protein [Spironucleus salmonicida]